MRYSQLFGRTKRDAPAEITDPTLRLAYRAGLGRPAANGQWLHLPLAANVLAQMHYALRPALSELGAQELRGVADVDLAALAAAEIQSYKQLSARVFWTNRSATRLHIAGFDANADAAQATRERFQKLITDFFDYSAVQAESAEHLDGARIWYATSPALDLEILKSNAGNYAATRAAAVPYKTSALQEAALALQEVETPHSDTIEALAGFLNVPVSRTAKAVFYSSGDKVIFAVVRGDLQIDEDKVKRALGINSLRWATDDEIVRVGATPKYASPIGTRGATIIVDDSIANSPNLVAGANKPGYHLLNTNIPRDYKPHHITDIALARVGEPTPDGQGELALVKGILLAELPAPRALSPNFLDMNGKAQKPYAVRLELDLGATLLAHIGAHHDDKGILWTRALAPYDLHLVALNVDNPEVAAALNGINDARTAAGLDVLFDDRNESAGVKFNDADLIGIPLRLTVGPKTVAQNSVELKLRAETTARPVLLDNLAQELTTWMNRV